MPKSRLDSPKTHRHLIRFSVRDVTAKRLRCFGGLNENAPYRPRSGPLRSGRFGCGDRSCSLLGREDSA